VPKIAHYFVKNAYAPLQVVALFKSFSYQPEDILQTEIWLLDDRRELKGKGEVWARLFNGKLQMVAERKIEFVSNGKENILIGKLDLGVPKENHILLLLVLDLLENGRKLARNYYWFNFREEPGCLFNLPKTRLSAHIERDKIVVKNIGELPAVGVYLFAPEISDCLRLEDGYFWLEPGEEKEIGFTLMPNIGGKRKSLRGLRVRAWNAETIEVICK
jgi:hypothetical protein